MKRNIAIVSSLLVFLFVGGIKTSWGADPAVAACIRQYEAEYIVAMNLSQRIFASGRATQPQHLQMQASENNLRQLRIQLHRSGQTINECKAIGQQINKELTILAEIEKFPEDTRAVAACVKYFESEYIVAMNLAQRIFASGRATQTQHLQLNEIQAKLRELRRQLWQTGLKMDQCKSIGQQINNEHGILARMPLTGAQPQPQPQPQPGPQPGLRPLPRLQPRPMPEVRIQPAPAPQARIQQPAPTPQAQPQPRIQPAPIPAVQPAPNAQTLAQCRDQATRLHAETVQLIQRARASRRISGQESRQLHAMESRLYMMKRRLLRGGLTMSDCRAVEQQIGNERAVVAKMATR